MKLENIIKGLIYICSGIILMYLLLVSLFSTCMIGTDATGSAHTFYVRDYPIIHLMFVFILMRIVYWLKRKIRFTGSYDKAVLMVIGCWGIVAALWILCSMEEPMHDSANVLLAARQMRQYNFSSFIRNGYLSVWAGNRGLALFFYLISFIIGVDNYIVLQLLNVVAGMVIFFLLYKMIGEEWGKGKRMAFYAVVLCACFLPLLLYTTFIYGDIYGLCLAVMALYAQLKYFSGRKYFWMVLSVFFIALAVLLKMNYVIILIAMAIVMLYDILLNKDWKKSLIYLMICIAGTMGGRIGSNMLLENITRMEMGEGVPSEAWIAMGLQEGGGTAGSYNGYNLKVYEENGYNNQCTKEAARENIRESLQKFKENPEYMVSFLARKVANQWNNPGCGMLNNGIEMKRGLSRIINSVKAGGAKTLFRNLLNIYQVWILLGAVSYIVLKKGKTDYEWIFFLIFLGGFAFHLFWEAGSRYAFPYYLLLIPYSCMGLSSLEEKAENILRDGQNIETFSKKYRHGIVCLLLTAAVSFLPIDLLGKVVYISKEKETEKSVDIEDGYYSISPAGDDKLCLSETDGGIMLMSVENMQQIVSICRIWEHQVIRFMPSQNSLELGGGENVCPVNVENAFEWHFVRVENEENKYYILVDDKTALAYNLDDWTVKLREFSERDNMQIWTIIKEGGKAFAR